MIIQGNDTSNAKGTLVSSAVGAAGLGTMSYYAQKALIKAAKPADILVKTQLPKSKLFMSGVKDWLLSLKPDIALSQKVSWKAVGKSGIKGALILGNLYLLYKGIQSAFTNTSKEQ